MKRIDRYLLAETLPPLTFGLLLYSTLVVVSATIPRLQWVIGVPVLRLAEWLALQFPAAVVQTLPIAVVLAVLMAFGRLAANNELLAMQAGALSLGRIARLFVIIGIGATCLALALNQWVLPETNARVGAIYWRLTTGQSGLFRLAGQNLPVADFTLHFERADRRTDELFDVRVERWSDRTLSVLFAERATFEPRGLRLHDYRTLVVDFASLEDPEGDATETLRNLVRAQSRASTPQGSLLLTVDIDEEELITRFSSGGFEDPRSITGSLRAANDPGLSASERRAAAVLFHRKVAEPFASLVLLLVAVPLSLTYARSRSIAFGLSLVVTLVWYLLLTLGQLTGQTGATPVWLGAWLPNIALGTLGAFLLSRRRTPG